MEKFVILTDSCSDLSGELRAKYDIEYVPMHFSCDDREYVADLDYKEISKRDFYNLMRDGKRIITAQANMEDYRRVFESYASAGVAVLSISCSSALSASVKASYVAKDEVLKSYPDAKIICIDSLMSCAGLALINIKAAMMRDAGAGIDEVAEWIENNKLAFNQEACVESLTYLKRAGRVSAASAFFGGILSVKPILISDAKGRNVAVEKVKGRRASIKRAAERFAEEYVKSDLPVIVSHADCAEDAELFKSEIVARLTELGDTSTEVLTEVIGPIVGASVGPGTMGVYFFGKEVTVGKDD